MILKVDRVSLALQLCHPLSSRMSPQPRLVSLLCLLLCFLVVVVAWRQANCRKMVENVTIYPQLEKGSLPFHFLLTLLLFLFLFLFLFLCLVARSKQQAANNKQQIKRMTGSGASMLVAVLCCACFALHAAGAPTLLAGVAEVDGTLPVGVPLAGYNHGDRRAEYWPVPNNTAYTSFMTPSVGVMDPTHIRCLALRQGQKEYVVSEKEEGEGEGGGTTTNFYTSTNSCSVLTKVLLSLSCSCSCNLSPHQYFFYSAFGSLP